MNRLSNWIIQDLRRLQSDAVALQQLKRIHGGASVTALYGNAAKISSNARQATAYEQSARGSEFAIRPLLHYYAYLHWIKAILYLADLSYPRGSSLLQHGMSVRKVKREGYRWPLDYAYIYKEGVLQSFRNVVDPVLRFPTKLPIGHLLGSIPVVAEALGEFYAEFQHVYPLYWWNANPDTSYSDLAAQPPQGRPSSDGRWIVDRQIASNIGLTPEEWLHAYHSQIGGLPNPSDPVYVATKPKSPPVSTNIAREINAHRGREMMRVEFGSANFDESDGGPAQRDPDGYLSVPAPDITHPWVLADEGGYWMSDGHAYPQWLSHLVTVYVLSTLCRYNAVEWLDIVHWSNDRDAHLVREYLQVIPAFPDLVKTIAVPRRPN